MDAFRTFRMERPDMKHLEYVSSEGGFLTMRGSVNGKNELSTIVNPTNSGEGLIVPYMPFELSIQSSVRLSR